MTVLAFSLRPKSRFDAYQLKVTLRKGAREWFFEIKPLGDSCQTGVRMDRKPHRAQHTTSLTIVQMISEQYHREIASLEQDGWGRVAGSSPSDYFDVAPPQLEPAPAVHPKQ
jgi:hypothetical protein